MHKAGGLGVCYQTLRESAESFARTEKSKMGFKWCSKFHSQCNMQRQNGEVTKDFLR